MGILSKRRCSDVKSYCDDAETRRTRVDGYKAVLWVVSQRLDVRLLYNSVESGGVCNCFSVNFLLGILSKRRCSDVENCCGGAETRRTRVGGYEAAL